MDNEFISLDVREDIRSSREPFSKIMNAVAALEPNQKLLLIAPFEPVPPAPIHSGDYTFLADTSVQCIHRPTRKPLWIPRPYRCDFVRDHRRSEEHTSELQ